MFLPLFLTLTLFTTWVFERGGSMHENGIMDVDGLCEFLKTSRSTVYKLAQSGQVPARKVGARLWRFNEDDVVKWLHSPSGANALAAFGVAKTGRTTESGKSWDETLSQVGFSKDQIGALSALSLDTPMKIMKTTSTKVGRATLCRALGLTENALDGIVSKLVAKIDEAS